MAVPNFIRRRNYIKKGHILKTFPKKGKIFPKNGFPKKGKIFPKKGKIFPKK
jgi:hypothetical protein